jgi:hypothetical protein
MSLLAVKRPSRPSPPVDARVPELALLSDGSLGEVLGRLLATNAVVPAPPRVTYLEYSQGARLVLQVSVEIDGLTRSAVVRAGKAVTHSVRSTGTRLPGTGAWVHWLPADPQLPLLGASSTQLRGLVCDARGAEGATPVDGSARVMAYVPGRRATIALSPYVLKTYGSPAAFRAARGAMALLGDAHELPTPRGIRSLPGWLTTVQQQVSGTPAGLEDALPLAATAGRLLHRLHASDRLAAARRDPSSQLHLARTAVDVLAAVLPDQRDRATALLARLARTAPTGLPLVLSHGDFTIDQLLVSGDGSVVVTDVDNACQAPAALDVAAFAANLVSGRDGDAEHAEAVLAALADSHGWPPALRWHFAVAVLRRCDRPFRRWKKGWPEKSEAILDLVEKVTASRS